MFASDSTLVIMLLGSAFVSFLSLVMGTGDKPHHRRNQAIVLNICLICFVYPLVELGFLRKGAWLMGGSLMLGTIVLSLQYWRRSNPVLIGSSLAIAVPVGWYFLR